MKIKLVTMILSALPLLCSAQKLELGSTTTKDGGAYQGELLAGIPHGKGKATYKNGNIYEGEYIKGKRQGYGIYTFSDGEKYEGEWFQDQQHGKGVFFFKNDDRYDGMWYRDYMQGHGIMFYHNGDKYDGDWMLDKREGKGTLNYVDGDVYEGQWQNDVQHGKGIYRFKNGDVYEGDYVLGQRTGTGIFHFANGNKYFGQFKNGKFNGNGTFTKKNGEVFRGWFIDGELEGPDRSLLPNETITYTEKWTGTGFALKGGYIITNYHVVLEASVINICGINGDFSNEMKATVVGADKTNDLALLKIVGDAPVNFNSIPYGFKSKIADVGEDVYVLGYPLTATMGEEIKLTNGIISAKTGFNGDVSQYQISVPIQPGNSGGPLIDYNGNVLGVVCAKHRDAENASYAVKTSQVRNLIESVSDLSIMNTTNTLKGKNLKDQVKLVNKYVYIIKCCK